MTRRHVQFDVFSSSTRKPPLELLVPEGALVLFGVVWPKRIGGYRCVAAPQRVNYTLAAVLPDGDEHSEIEDWLHKLEPAPAIALNDIPRGFHGASIIKGHWVTNQDDASESEMISCLTVGDDIVQHVGFGLRDNSLQFVRLGSVVRLDCADVPRDSRFALICEWSRNGIAIGISWIDSQSGEIQVRRARRESCELAPSEEVLSAIHDSAGPAQLVHGGEGLDPDALNTPRLAYRDLDDLYTTVLGTLTHIAYLIRSKSQPSAFWEQSPRWIPKSEPRCGHTLRLLLEQGFASKNISVWQEPASHSGNTDFCLSGVLANYRTAVVTLELKRAHSARLEHGLTVQLPQYMEEHDASTGVYGVLWFKGEHCDEPARHNSPDELIEAMLAIKPALVRDVIVFDVSRQPPASKR